MVYFFKRNLLGDVAMEAEKATGEGGGGMVRGWEWVGGCMAGWVDVAGWRVVQGAVMG